MDDSTSKGATGRRSTSELSEGLAEGLASVVGSALGVGVRVEGLTRLSGGASRETWSFVVAKFMTDPVWWFFLIWLPDYFKKTRGLDIKQSWVHLVTIYAIVTVLSIAGGWLTGDGHDRQEVRPRSGSRKISPRLHASHQGTASLWHSFVISGGLRSGGSRTFREGLWPVVGILVMVEG